MYIYRIMHIYTYVYIYTLHVSYVLCTHTHIYIYIHSYTYTYSTHNTIYKHLISLHSMYTYLYIISMKYKHVSILSIDLLPCTPKAPFHPTWPRRCSSVVPKSKPRTKTRQRLDCLGDPSGRAALLFFMRWFFHDHEEIWSNGEYDQAWYDIA